VRKPGGELGTRCEIKNVNSIRFVKQAIEYEARRQVEIIEGGGKIEQETRCSIRPRRDALDALQGGCARLPLLPRSRSAAAGA
jgi:Glu-tRNA(Gln) amidotransferase subunit E-like FAD-binding protein